MITLDKIVIYPIKSLDGIEVNQSSITTKGSLLHDREFAMFNADGKIVNAKRNPKVHLLRCWYNLNDMKIELSVNGNDEKFIFNLNSQIEEIEDWMSIFFEEKIRLKKNSESGFPDDLSAYGPTLVSKASLLEVASWFNFSYENILKRFRVNLVVDQAPLFWEDKLYGNEGEKIYFTVGNVEFAGINPCNRCPVPSRNPENSVEYTDFQKIFAEKRKATLPAWANKNRFNHFYKFCLNTQTPLTEAGKNITINDEVVILNK
jgi:Uncharacterized Fe-S protein